MSKRNHNIDVNEYDYGDYGGEDYGHEQLDDEELAIIESKKQLKKDKKMQKKAKGIQESDIDEIVSAIKSKDAFTREQIRGTLENFKGDKTETTNQLIFKICK